MRLVLRPRMSRTRSLLLLSAVAACSSPQAASTSTTSTSSSSSGSATSSSSGGPVDAGADAGWDAAAACDAPDASSTLPCGSLAFEKSPVLSRARNHHVTLLVPSTTSPSGTVMYAIGGASSQTTTLDFVDHVPINADGSLGKWATGPALTLAVGGLVGEVVSGVIVVAGGTNAATGVTDQAFSAVLQPDGTLAAWKSAGSVLKPRMHAASVTKDGTMWILGGFQDPNVYSDIVSATVKPDGTVSTWATAGALPGPRSHFSATLIDTYVYIAGGLAMSAFDDPPDLQDIWRGQIQGDGTIGGWVQQTNLPVAEATHAAFFYGGYFHVCGGINNVPAQEDRCWRAPIDGEGTLGAFEEIATLPIARGHVHQMPVLGTMVYSVAGAIDFNLDSTTQIDIGTFQMDPTKGHIRPRTPEDSAVRAHKGKCHVGG
jgi:hypothetical protein